MGRVHRQLDGPLSEFIAAQQMFFVATAPLAADGHVNLSPKGLDTFRVLDERTVAYLDLAGSGIETVAHLRENGRIVIMFCAFAGAPRIVRLYGRGRAVEAQDAQWATLARGFAGLPGARSIIVVDIERVSDSCGFGVPLYEYRGQRTRLTDNAERKGAEGIREYMSENNRASIDGLPGLAHA